MNARVPVIAVDGPSGVGKGTLCQWLANRLGFHLLDSGALYRLTALAALRRNLALEDESRVAVVAAGLATLRALTETPVSNPTARIHFNLTTTGLPSVIRGPPTISTLNFPFGSSSIRVRPPR